MLYAKILVINLMHLGDLLLTTPVLRALRTSYPEAHIALMADAKLADLVKYNENIDELIAIDKKGYHNTVVHYLQLIAQMRQQHFDLIVNLHANERASCIAAFSGAKKVVGYASPGVGVFFDYCQKNNNKIKHQVQSHFDVLRAGLGIQTINDQGLEMWLDDGCRQSAETIWKQSFGAQDIKVIGLNTGASWETKRWGKDYYATLADQLLNLGYGVAYFGGPMDVELVQETVALMKNKQHENLAIFTGKMTLLELAALLKKTTVLVTNDSGPMHVAVAMDVPLVTMFGPSPVTGFAPYSNRSVAIKTGLPCFACGQHQCQTLDCMKNISVETVLKYTLELAKLYGDEEGTAMSDHRSDHQCVLVTS